MLLRKKDKKAIEIIITYCKDSGMDGPCTLALYNTLAKLFKRIEKLEERTSCAPRQESVNSAGEYAPPNKPQHETALK